VGQQSPISAKGKKLQLARKLPFSSARPDGSLDENNSAKCLNRPTKAHRHSFSSADARAS
jgi:hypothetical protein